MCVTAHALLSALVARLARGGPDATLEELRAILGAGCPMEDVRVALARDAPAFRRARDTLDELDTQAC
jgi:hypothetical protein